MPETPKNPKRPASLDAAAPKIPGVPPPQPKNAAQPKGSASSTARKPPAHLWAAAGVAVLAVLITLAWWLGGSRKQAESFPTKNAAANAPGLSTASKQIATAPPVAPGVIAKTDELEQPWASKVFLFRNSAGKDTPAMLVRLPGDTYWAFALREPYGTCKLVYITDLNKLRDDYNFAAAHPMVGDPCTHTVFDLAKYGSGPNGEVRGDIVAGTGVRPPLAIEVQIKGSEILATRSEADISH